jgi:hypothetical protein
MIKNYDVFFSNICYYVYYHLVKFQLKTPPMHAEIKKKDNLN